MQAQIAAEVLGVPVEDIMVYSADTDLTPFDVGAYASGTTFEVDVDTGQVTATKLVMAVDCGVAINPTTASGQVEGAMLLALGYALAEEVALDDAGRVVNAGLGPYWVYRADDAPPMEVFLVQTTEPSGPFGAKAVGEIPVDGVGPAVRNAVLDATGVAINDLPLTPERVWRALHPDLAR